MSYVTTNWAWNTKLPITHKFLLVALADMGDENHSCFPGQQRLADMCGCSIRTVQRRLEDLEKWGYITRETRRRPDGYKTSDRYYLQVSQTLPVKLSPDKNSDSHMTKTDSHMTRGVVALTSSKEYSEELLEAKRELFETKRGTRLARDFAVTTPMREWAAEHTPSVNLVTQTEMFIDYWNGIPGARGLKSDWIAAWRNWLRISHQRELDKGWKPREEYYRAGTGN